MLAEESLCVKSRKTTQKINRLTRGNNETKFKVHLPENVMQKFIKEWSGVQSWYLLKKQEPGKWKPGKLDMRRRTRGSYLFAGLNGLTSAGHRAGWAEGVGEIKTACYMPSLKKVLPLCSLGIDTLIIYRTKGFDIYLK